MGVGGLLMEIVTRPQPRTIPLVEAARNVAAIILARSLDPDGRPGRAARRTRRQRVVRPVAVVAGLEGYRR